MTMRTPLALALVAQLCGCNANTLTQSWQLDRLRILGVRATPAEPHQSLREMEVRSRQGISRT